MIKRTWIDTRGALDYVQTLAQDHSELAHQSAGWASQRRLDKPKPLYCLLKTMEDRLNVLAGNQKTVEWWAVYLPKDAYIKPHNHSSDWAAVVYIDSHYMDGQIIFTDFDDEYSIQPEKGLALIFPGNCTHLVQPSHTCHRYSLAMNRV